MMSVRLAILSVVLVNLPAGVAAAQNTPLPVDPYAMLASADANGDGSVSRPEFIAQRANTFDRLDRDKDGALIRDEFLAAVPSGMRRTFAATQFGGVDSSGDGKLSRGEFNATPTPGFDRADADDNDILSPTEIQAARGGRKAR